MPLQSRVLSTIAASTVIAAGVLAAAVPAQAAGGCRAVRPQSGFYEGGRVASEMLTVPVNARCTTISVKNIVDPANPADHCATFLVGFFPPGSDGEYTEPVQACSTGPGGPEIVLATAVPDGVDYRVLYNIDYLGQHLRYGVRL
jgi:hypothetical protein